VLSLRRLASKPISLEAAFPPKNSPSKRLNGALGAYVRCKSRTLLGPTAQPGKKYFGRRVEERSLGPLGEARLGRIGLETRSGAHRREPDIDPQGCMFASDLPN
jgi:hypothetical protein